MFVGNWQASTITREENSPFTYGIQTLALEGQKTGILKKVEVVGDGELELLGAMLLAPPRAVAAVQFMDGWPATSDEDLDLSKAVPALGAEIGLKSEHPEGWELLLGIRAVREGYWSLRAIRVTYTVDGHDFQVDLPNELTVCTDARYEVDGQCLPK